MFTVQNLTLSFGRKVILSNVSMNAKSGEFTIIIGPNGAGKSSLLKCLSGETLPTSGQVFLDKTPLSDLGAEKLAEVRGVLPQASSLSFPFTVGEVVSLGIQHSAPLGKDETHEIRISNALQKVEMASFVDSPYHVLSGGEKQRVHLARVLCQVWQPVTNKQSKGLFLDEPTSSLDLKHQFDVLDIARDYANRGGTVIAILHDINLARRYADQIIILSEGKLIANGPPENTITLDRLHSVFKLDTRMIEAAFISRFISFPKPVPHTTKH